MKTSIKLYVITILIIGWNSYVNAQCFSQVSAGYFYAFGLKTNNTLWAWGNNTQSGQLGDGTNIDHWIPTQITTATNWQSIACGMNTMMGIKSNGTLWVCGDNTSGELGLGNGGGSINILTQQGIATNWKQVTVGSFSSYGIKTDGTLWGWGQNDGGQMGNNTCCNNQTTPTQIGIATDWKQVAATNTRSAFAIKTNGTLWAWGSNINGILGDSSISVLSVPTQKDTATDWDKLAVGHSHALAIKTNGTLWGWGAYDDGETGQDPDNLMTFPSEPFQIPGTWKTVAAGFRFSMGIKTDGTLWAWGKNKVGQLGDKNTTNRFVPYQISTATNWQSVSCGYQFTIALRTDGSLWSWGNNYYGELGNGTDITPQALPTAIPVADCSLDTPQYEAVTSLVLTPNPAHDQLQLTYKGTAVVETISIYDLTGRVVMQLAALGNTGFSTTFSTANLQSGSYFLVLQNSTQTVTTKQFVKE